MLYVFHGSDTAAVRTKARKLVDGLLKKQPDAEVFRLDAETLTPLTLEPLIAAQGLFVQKHIVELDFVGESKAALDTLVEYAEQLAASENIFLVREGALLAASKKALTAHAAHSEELKAPAKKDNDRGAAFAIADAFAAKNKRDLWIELVKARRNGTSDEELHGMLFWAVKMLRLAQQSKSAEDAGIKPFVYSKYKRYAANFTECELAAHSRTLIELIMTSRSDRPGAGLAPLLERWTLTVF